MEGKSEHHLAVRQQDFPAHYESLDPIREFVGEAARDCGLDDAATYAVQLSVDEACTNIIEHAYKGECIDPIHCTCKIDPQRLTITLEDNGQPFDPSEVTLPDLNVTLEERDTGGLGLFFIYKLMDEVHFAFKNEKNGGNTLILVKRKEMKH